MILALGVGVLGGLGATLRYLIDNLVSRRFGRSIPWGTIVINLVGSFGIGLLVGSDASGQIGTSLTALLGVGLLGGFTTASTLNVEAARSLSDQRPGTLLMTSLGTLGGSLAVGLIGYHLAT